MGRIEAAQAAFTEIYKKDVWGIAKDIEPEPGNVEQYIKLVQEFMRQNEIRSVVEFGCSVWQHLSRIDWQGIEYDGFDIVKAVVDAATERHGADNIRFHVVGEGTRLPRADLLICKDVLQHLPNNDIKYYLRLFKGLYKYLLITDDVYPDIALNHDIPHGGYRAVRLDIEPFNEQCAVLQRLAGTTFGIDWVKHTSLQFGTPPADGLTEGLALTDGPTVNSREALLPRRIGSRLKRIVSRVYPLNRRGK